MKYLKLFIYLHLIFSAFSLIGQGNEKVFTLKDFLSYVKNYHPIAKKTDLLILKGEKKVMKARGGFDPKLSGSVDQKKYDKKEYYNLIGAGLKIPTWYGIELKTGFNKNEGVFLNPENNLSDGGLWNIGISIPLGQNFIIDNRRATLKQALYYEQSTKVEQQKIMNDLLFESISQYWNWVKVWNMYQIYEESVQLASQRFSAVKQSFIFGDKPAIDTLESYIQLQTREISRNEYLLKFQNESLALSNYLWFENNIPLEISNELTPPKYEELESEINITSDTLNSIISQLDKKHPDLQLYQLKLSSLEIDRKLKAEKLKPKLNVNYNVLNEPVGGNFIEGISSQDYKWGLDFSFPVFLRKQRSELQLSKIKIQETNLDRNQKLLNIKNKIQQYYNKQLNLQGQIELYASAVVNYERMLEGEKKKFDAGESSLFLVNSRENKLINAKLKFIDLQMKFNVSIAGVRWAAGILFNQ